MRYLYCFFILFYFNSISFGQKQNAVKTEAKEIENGKITKQYIDDKLNSFTVDIAAVNYGNTLFFTKKDNLITIKDGQNPNAIIRIYLKGKKFTTDLMYKNKELMYIESIDLDLNSLPPNSIISSQYKDGKPESFISRSQMEDIHGLDKVMKLFWRMDKKTSLTNIDTIFDTLADDFSQEDALLKIYFGRYAEKYEPLPTAYLNTDNTGKIKKGIMWTKTSDQNGKYNIYSNGKVIKSVNQNLTDFQKTIMDYMEKM
ncbi:hypothetical protein HZQ11_14290 [Elizabethkingia anophelis]|uniref:hypothetical protein n=1 Tax=Elizabethkingia TaxID=308865 RepID=UPI000739835E|nr:MULTISPECIES: hypothetical protein [Elizabethkingia]KUF46042.1 hypothetical protein AS358_03645 [Elizabethkingia anophelis]MCT3645428.1 hypothetical protein [Elizabethkingia anophelis]MCT3652058.1 hypothetical protein [Elizabethkingia anophelis]MCT3656530.1 hypothetical protein [Elizabethkingia anophelis]MCT3659467.1 hypothetical protein [Elizabethkingia anophelis]